MRAVCLEDFDELCDEGGVKLFKGNIYHIIGEWTNKKEIIAGRKRVLGLYYQLAEAGRNYYHHSLFIIINDQKIDETEFKRSINKVA